jgi:prepilin-type processing-associated H-X9-DG protein/prepilin-type N-terminal cleavage/methylation domain-containing protein
VRRGLTIPELLVTIAILAMVISLAIPAISSVQSATRTAHCATHLRSMAQFALLYVADNEGRFPPSLRYEAGRIIDWEYERIGDSQLRPGAIWPSGWTVEQIPHCPLCPLASRTGPDAATGYNYNTTWLGGEAPNPWANGWENYRFGLTVAQVGHAGRCAMFGEGGYGTSTNRFMRAPSNAIEHNVWTIYSGTQSYRHGGRTNVAFADGHTESRRGVFPGVHATEELLKWTDHPRNGFLSNDDSAYGK